MLIFFSLLAIYVYRTPNFLSHEPPLNIGISILCISMNKYMHANNKVPMGIYNLYIQLNSMLTTLFNVFYDFR